MWRLGPGARLILGSTKVIDLSDSGVFEGCVDLTGLLEENVAADAVEQRVAIG